MKPVYQYCLPMFISGCLMISESALAQTTQKNKTASKSNKPAPVKVEASKKEAYKEPVRLKLPDDDMYPNSRNPDAPTATVAKKDSTPAQPKLGMPVLTFDKKEVDFGKIKTGDKPTHTYTIINTGDQDMDIDLVSGCDCTEIDWTRTSIKPGEKGFVKIIFHSDRAEHEDHKRPLKKDVTVILKQTYPQNGYPIVDVLYFSTYIVD